MWDGEIKAALTKIRRPAGVLALGWASVGSAAAGRTEHRPLHALYPPSVVRKIAFVAGDGLGWRISALRTVRAAPAPYKIVVITGAPSWAEYWAPTLAALPADREMIVVNRPGYGDSAPSDGVYDIQTQARALAPLLQTALGQKLILVGQSYGAAIAAVMAAARPAQVRSLVLLSSYLGVPGPTARWLVNTGARFANILPRDLRHAVAEISAQPMQIHHLHAALPKVRAPIHVIHGEDDDFAPIEAARALIRDIRTARPVRFDAVPGAGHFFTEAAPDRLAAMLEACVPAPSRWEAMMAEGSRGIDTLSRASKRPLTFAPPLKSPSARGKDVNTVDPVGLRF